MKKQNEERGAKKMPWQQKVILLTPYIATYTIFLSGLASGKYTGKGWEFIAGALAAVLLFPLLCSIVLSRIMRKYF
ncbi:MAG: hypothetical protein GY754_00740 [bacterium]|nr:hypothetical protein [bacterium]